MPRRRFRPMEEWEDPRHRAGLWGERVAMAFLTSCGWSIEAHRFRLGRHDVDVVARRGWTVAFVEVKTRRSDAFGSPFEAIGWEKRRVLARVAALWRLRHGQPGDVYRFDVIGIRRRPGQPPEVEHLADAWRL
ncbi:MAG TPA: YraN family protein [Gemmatimonadales bacterium]|nr:YraN family protein [Gemmatimonadales bacterium]